MDSTETPRSLVFSFPLVFGVGRPLVLGGTHSSVAHFLVLKMLPLPPETL